VPLASEIVGGCGALPVVAELGGAPPAQATLRRPSVVEAGALQYGLVAAENEAASRTSCAVTAPHASIALALSSLASACAAVGYRFLRSAMYLCGDRCDAHARAVGAGLERSAPCNSFGRVDEERWLHSRVEDRLMRPQHLPAEWQASKKEHEGRRSSLRRTFRVAENEQPA
jgi:hypothetical protein